MKDNEKVCCKWCTHCTNTDINKGTGFCYVDIGDFIKDTNNTSCCDYSFDDNLDRC